MGIGAMAELSLSSEASLSMMLAACSTALRAASSSASSFICAHTWSELGTSRVPAPQQSEQERERREGGPNEVLQLGVEFLELDATALRESERNTDAHARRLLKHTIPSASLCAVGLHTTVCGRRLLFACTLSCMFAVHRGQRARKRTHEPNEQHEPRIAHPSIMRSLSRPASSGRRGAVCAGRRGSWRG